MITASSAPAVYQPGREPGRIQPQRLDQAAEPVAQVHAEQDHPEDVEATRRPALEAHHHHRYTSCRSVPFGSVLLAGWRTPGSDDIGREVQDVENDEAEDDQPAHHHRAPGPATALR